jgi:hypothetical protein
MADGVRRQFVHGQNHVLGLVFGKPRVTDAGSHLCPRRWQCARIESQIKDRRYAVGTCRSRPSRMGPAATSGRSVRMSAVSHMTATRKPEGPSVVTPYPAGQRQSFPGLDGRQPAAPGSRRRPALAAEPTAASYQAR